MVVPDDSGSAFSFSGELAPYKDAYINAAKAVGAPYVDVVSNPNAPRTRDTCWGATAWMNTGNNGYAFNDAVLQEIGKQGLPELDLKTPSGKASAPSVPYVLKTCVNLEP